MSLALSKRLASLETQLKPIEPVHIFIVGVAVGVEPKPVTGYRWGDERIYRLPNESDEDLKQRAIDTANASSDGMSHLKLFFECTEDYDWETSEKP